MIIFPLLITIIFSIGTFTEELARYFIGGGIELEEPSDIQSGADRLHLRTVAAGTIQLEIGVILRGFKKFGIEY